MHKDRFGNVWVTSEEADKLYKATQKLLAECDELQSVGLLPEDAHSIRKAMTATRKVLTAIESR